MQKTIFITGISSGFGKATAKLLSEKGHKVYGTVRNLSDIIPGVNVLKMDMTEPESIQMAVNTVINKEGRIDILINNAGMHSGGALETTPYETVKLQLDTNVSGMVNVLQNVLPHMRKQRSGTIINISSIGGLMGLPFQSYYSASKFAIEGLSSALRMEVKPFNIKVVVVNPGDFKTNNTKNRRNFLNPFDNDPYEEQFKKSLAIIEKDETKGWPADKMARKLTQIAESQNPCGRYIIASPLQRLAVILLRILPDKWFYSMLADHYGIK